ncbi:Tetraspanin-18 [Chamberlinius hualienensis]
MAVGCGAKCAKALLIIFNLIFWLSGCALLALGIWILIDNDRENLFNLITVENEWAIMKYLAYGLVGIGGFILIVGFFGCCGALQESKCLLVTYFIFLFVVLGAELAVGIFAVIYREQLLSNLGDQLTKRLQTYYHMDSTPGLTTAIDFSQYHFDCCGIRNANEYKNSSWARERDIGDAKVPKTCCVLSNNGTDAWINASPKNDTLCQDGNVKFMHQKGCLDSIEEWIKKESALLIGVGLGVAGLEIFGMIFAICLCRNLGEEA